MQNQAIKKDATLGAKEESKHGANVVENMVGKMNVIVDAKHGAKEESKHVVTWEEKNMP